MQACPEFAERFVAFFDGELEGEAADEVAAHLDSCPACRAAAEATALLDAPLAALGRPPPPPAVAPAEWARCWEAIEAAVVAGSRARDPEIADSREVALVLAADRAARLVRRLIPLAAAALLFLTFWGWTIQRAHADRHGAPPPPSIGADAAFGGF